MIQTALVAFSKDPTRVPVKTRLGETIDQKRRIQIYNALLNDTLDDLNNIAKAKVYLACYPDKNSLFFNELEKKHGVELIDQKGSDLGEKMANVFEALLKTYSKVAVFGTDTPNIPVKAIEEALCTGPEHSATHSEDNWDVLMGSAKDGGYYTIGLRKDNIDLCAAIFEDVVWSASSVFETTRKNCLDLGLKISYLPATADIDTIQDLKNLVDYLKATPDKKNREIVKVLEAIGMPVTGS